MQIVGVGVKFQIHSLQLRSPVTSQSFPLQPRVLNPFRVPDTAAESVYPGLRIFIWARRKSQLCKRLANLTNRGT